MNLHNPFHRPVQEDYNLKVTCSKELIHKVKTSFTSLSLCITPNTKLPEFLENDIYKFSHAVNIVHSTFLYYDHFRYNCEGITIYIHPQYMKDILFTNIHVNWDKETKKFYITSCIPRSNSVKLFIK